MHSARPSTFIRRFVVRFFEYYAPKTLDEAIQLLVRHGEGAYPLAGGTDLVTKARYGHLRPRVIVNLKRIPGLNDIAPEEDGGLRLGALVTLAEIARSLLMGERYPLLAQTARKMGSVLIRNLATVGGNLCNAAPSADMAPPLIALGAEAVIVGPRGERRVRLEKFFHGPGQTELRHGELLTAIRLPPPRPRTRGVYLKHIYRQAMDIAIVGVAVLLQFDEQEAIAEDARIVLGAVAPTPLRVPEAESVLIGAPLTEDRRLEAARRAARAARPIDDTYSSAWYRREMVGVLTRRALEHLVSHSPER